MKKKTTILTLSGLVTVVLIIWEIIGNFKLCGGAWGSCVDVLAEIEVILFSIVPLFVVTLLTYKMREEVFDLWWKFARVFIPLTMLAVFIAPSYPDNSFFPIEVEGSVLLYFCANFIISSILIVVAGYKSLRKGLQLSNKSIAWIVAFSSIISIFAWYYLFILIA